MEQKHSVKIARAASEIAGAAFDDAEGTLAERLRKAMEHKNLGTDGDLTAEDRDALGLLLEALEGMETRES